MSTVKQRWSCTICGFMYDSPIAVSEVYCPKSHLTASGKGPRTGRARMELVDGTAARSRKGATRGKT